MAITAVAILTIFFRALRLQDPDPLLVVVELILLLFVSTLGLTLVGVKIWEQLRFPTGNPARRRVVARRVVRRPRTKKTKRRNRRR